MHYFYGVPIHLQLLQSHSCKILGSALAVYHMSMVHLTILCLKKVLLNSWEDDPDIERKYKHVKQVMIWKAARCTGEDFTLSSAISLCSKWTLEVGSSFGDSVNIMVRKLIQEFIFKNHVTK